MVENVYESLLLPNADLSLPALLLLCTCTCTYHTCFNCNRGSKVDESVEKVTLTPLVEKAHFMLPGKQLSVLVFHVKL